MLGNQDYSLMSYLPEKPIFVCILDS